MATMFDSIDRSDPPFIDQYSGLFNSGTDDRESWDTGFVGACQLPLIDLQALGSCSNKNDRRACMEKIKNAASEWGFFQVVNHGVSRELLEKMRSEQVKLFGMPFEKKAGCRLLNDSYRWGTPTATSIKEFSWSEAFHVPLSQISDEAVLYGEFSTLWEVMEQLATSMSNLARLLAGILEENLDQPKQYFEENCNETTCFLRLNRYPPCPYSPEMYGLVPHTDSDFLTILFQDQVGGLQLMKDSRWVAVKPDPDALVVNIGDLFQHVAQEHSGFPRAFLSFDESAVGALSPLTGNGLNCSVCIEMQAWSNDLYKSVEHKVMANAKVERYSIAYFMCPSYDSTIGSYKEPSPYRKFTFGEYRQQVQEDVRKTGHKVYRGKVVMKKETIIWFKIRRASEGGGMHARVDAGYASILGVSAAHGHAAWGDTAMRDKTSIVNAVRASWGHAAHAGLDAGYGTITWCQGGR
ncbi:hypothetical protein ACLOJK_017221 [Asimina triloba]